jgi:hypothetical protein
MATSASRALSLLPSLSHSAAASSRRVPRSVRSMTLRRATCSCCASLPSSSCSPLAAKGAKERRQRWAGLRAGILPEVVVLKDVLGSGGGGAEAAGVSGSSDSLLLGSGMLCGQLMPVDAGELVSGGATNVSSSACCWWLAERVGTWPGQPDKGHAPVR